MFNLLRKKTAPIQVPPLNFQPTTDAVNDTPTQTLNALLEKAHEKIVTAFQPETNYEKHKNVSYGGILVFDKVEDFDYLYQRLRYVVDAILPHGTKYEMFLPERFQAVGWRWSPKKPDFSFQPSMREYGGLALTLIDEVGGPNIPIGMVLSKTIQGKTEYKGAYTGKGLVYEEEIPDIPDTPKPKKKVSHRSKK